MSNVVLMPHQVEIFNASRDQNLVAYYLDMGLGKTFLGSEKLNSFGTDYNLVVCQKSKIKDWYEHFTQFYPQVNVIDYTKFKGDIVNGFEGKTVIICNYDLVWRRSELSKLPSITLMLDESSLIQNETTKRSKFILNKLNCQNVILLSGTPTSGKYEKLWSQCRLLGWNISKREFYSRYVIEQDLNIKTVPYPIKVVVGYKNVEELKIMLRKHGAYFLKTEDVLSLPEQTFVNVEIDTIPAYRRFKKDKLVEIDGKTLLGDTTLTQMLYERMLCGQYNNSKLEAFVDLLESTDDRLIVFYNFNEELRILKEVAKNRPQSEINGSVKDLTAYENEDNSITFCQYAAAAKGQNLQKANKIVYFSPTLSCDDWMQSLKRIHRIGQSNPCFYYKLTCKNSIEEKIYKALEKGTDYTLRLFEEKNVNNS